MKQTSLLDNALIWLTAAISLAEIVAGTAYAGMGISGAVGSIVLGHIIGCFLLFEVALFGARKRQNAMGCASLAFGQGGGAFFATLNIVQLFGWTAVMIFNGAIVATAIFAEFDGAWGDTRVWCGVLGALVAVWVLLGVRRVWFLNLLCAVSLVILSGILVLNLLESGANFAVRDGAMGFWLGVELAVAMPISWLPLIADYTSRAARPTLATLVSVFFYGTFSTAMYLIGYLAASGGGSDIAAIITGSSLGVGALALVLFSTATTTFLDANSAGESATAIFAGLKPRPIAFLVTLAATGLVVYSLGRFSLNHIEPFLLVISAVFVPMSAVMLADFYITRGADAEVAWVSSLLKRKPRFWLRFVVWAAGVGLYYQLAGLEFLASVPTFIVTFIIASIVIKQDINSWG